ncbi:hypothetical protein A2U01_0051815, partial [Trifolium medium]|nr:hypothetical protein [Trifolium medium]
FTKRERNSLREMEGFTVKEEFNAMTAPIEIGSEEE